MSVCESSLYIVDISLLLEMFNVKDERCVRVVTES